MKTIHKIAIDRDGTGEPQTVSLPVGARIIGFAFQGQHYEPTMIPAVWFVRDVEVARTEEWVVQIRGTGHEFEDDMDYLAGPAFADDMVFHLVGRKA